MALLQVSPSRRLGHRSSSPLAAASTAVVVAVVALSTSDVVLAQTVTWSGGNMTWTQPDSTNWTSATYNSGITAGSYTFSGGDIGGSGGVAKSGAGTLTLTAANTYSGRP